MYITVIFTGMLLPCPGLYIWKPDHVLHENEACCFWQPCNESVMKMRVIILSLWDVDTPSVFCHNRFSTFFFSFFFLSNTFLSPACFFAIGPSCPFLLVSSSIPAVSFKLLRKECENVIFVWKFIVSKQLS